MSAPERPPRWGVVTPTIPLALRRLFSLESVATCLLALFLPLLWACGSIAGDQLKVPQVESVLRSRGVSDVLVPFAISPEMLEWLDQKVPSSGTELRKLHRLVEELFGELDISYAREYTGTAVEVFETRRANCLSFTHLFVGLAREMKIPVFFLEVRDLENYSREGDLIVHSDHIAVGYGPHHDLTIIDFAEQVGTQYRRIRAINDLTAVALFYSNKGAEHLRRGELQDATRWLKGAVAIDERLPAAWINYGVALRRSGKGSEAEAAYRRALEIDSTELAAYQNLAALLRMRGRSEEALELLSLTDVDGNRNPYSYVALGDLSQRHGRVEEAERFYRRAIRLDRKEAEPVAALGLLQLEGGDVELARKLLRRARRLDSEAPRVALLARRLGQGSLPDPR